MGFFSYNCNGCGHPLLSAYATDRENAWMQQAVALSANENRLVGEYDGYGRIGGNEIDDNPCVWHRACWERAGRPNTFKESTRAACQGYFFEDGAHDMAEPKLGGNP